MIEPRPPALQADSLPPEPVQFKKKKKREKKILERLTVSLCESWKSKQNMNHYHYFEPTLKEGDMMV